MDIKSSYLPLTLLPLILLVGCATQKPELQPIAIPCQKPVVDSNLLQPARRQAMSTLQTLLVQPLLNVPPTPPNLTP